MTIRTVREMSPAERAGRGIVQLHTEQRETALSNLISAQKHEIDKLRQELMSLWMALGCGGLIMLINIVLLVLK